MYKKITATAKEVVTSVKDGAKTVEVPQKYFEVELKGLGEGAVPDPSLFRYNGDSAQALETFSKLLGRPIAELSSAAEVLRINAVKVLTEFQTTSDNLLLVVGWMRKIDDGLQNRLANNDILFKNFGKVLLEQGLATDTVAKSVITSVSSSNVVADIVASTFQAPKQDILAPIDAIAKLAGVPLTDAVGVPDVLRKSLTALKADAAVMSNTCTANLQDYMSASYVDAGYIGVNYAL